MYCSGCDKDKPATAFSFKNKALGKRQSRCKKCQSDYRKTHYQDNREVLLKKQVEINRRTVRRNRKLIWQYLEAHPCVDCGEPDPVVLEFDHKGKKPKRAAISRMTADCYSWTTIQKEIAKCEVRCANCHRRRTAKQRGFYAYIGP